MKKTWIKIKRGLLDQKHREALGIRVWLYLYILDKTDWDTGTIIDWTDADAAEELTMPVRTVKDQRQGLEDAGYITCVRKWQSQKIIVHNWTNPKEYSGEVTNLHTDTELSECDPHTDTHSDTHSDTNTGSKSVPLSYIPHITDHISVDGDESLSDGMIGALSSAFTQASNITPYKLDEWNTSLTNMYRAGVTPETLAEVVRLMRDPPPKQKKLTVTGPWSCEKLAIGRQSEGQAVNLGLRN